VTLYDIYTYLYFLLQITKIKTMNTKTSTTEKMNIVYSVYSHLCNPAEANEFDNLMEAKRFLKKQNEDFILVGYEKGNFARTMFIIKRNYKY